MASLGLKAQNPYVFTPFDPLTDMTEVWGYGVVDNMAGAISGTDYIGSLAETPNAGTAGSFWEAAWHNDYPQVGTGVNGHDSTKLTDVGVHVKGWILDSGAQLLAANTGTNEFDAYAVLMLPTGETGGPVFSQAENLTAFGTQWWGIDSSFQPFYTQKSTTYTATSTLVYADEWAVVRFWSPDGDNTINVSVNGGPTETLATVSVTSGPRAQPWSVGSTYMDSGPAFVGGELAEWICCTVEQSSGVAANAISYLMTKYGITIPETLATGGDSIYVDQTHVYHKFTSGGTFSLITPGTLPVDYLVVGAGGGGSDGTTGVNLGSGGAGGQAKTGTALSVTTDKTITIGTGGAGADEGGTGGTGGNSVFGAITATGGSGAPPGRTGGANDDYAGGTNSGSTDSGGGAGAGAVGGATGIGGDGIEWPTGSGQYYGGGGGGNEGTAPAEAGGAGGGGAGEHWLNSPTPASDGEDGRGGGGGGAYDGASINSGSGGSGIVIVRYDPNDFVPT